jgi:hypothetical protein
MAVRSVIALLRYCVYKSGDWIKKRTFALILIFLVCLLFSVFIKWIFLGDRQKVNEIRSPAQIAIIIDDWGYSLKNLPLLFEINSPLTISILPNVIYSTKIAEAVHKRKNFEIILHQPLEPENTLDENLEPSTIYTSMPKEKIVSILQNALKSVPYSVGISNHMGSQATQNRRLMKIIFSEIRRQKLFFLDSLVTEDSICEELSRKMKVRFVQRNIFLDNKDSPEYIKQQLAQLVSRSKTKGSAVGIGHGREMTLKVLKEMIPKLEEQGIQLVHVSQLAK